MHPFQRRLPRCRRWPLPQQLRVRARGEEDRMGAQAHVRDAHGDVPRRGVVQPRAPDVRLHRRNPLLHRRVHDVQGGYLRLELHYDQAQQEPRRHSHPQLLQGQEAGNVAFQLHAQPLTR